MISSLRTANFRNLIDSETPTFGRDVFLVGENGQGKTNFIEALYFCSFGSTFRSGREGELIRNGEQGCAVELRVDGRSFERILIKYENKKKSIEIDGKRVEDRKELISHHPSIVFCHEDMDFVSGSPEDRRRFFDQTLSLYDPLYLDDLRRYRRVLRTRNRVLKPPFGQNVDRAMLDTLDPQFALYGSKLQGLRSEAASLFSQTLGRLYGEVSGIEGLSVEYLPSWKSYEGEEIVALLQERREQEISLGQSLSGPHRDRYIYRRGREDFAAQASTGQRRLLALLLRVAQALLFEERTGKKAVLLLDDVLLELDPEKRRRFLELLPPYEQAFYTFLPEEPYGRYQRDDTLVYQVSGGVLSPKGHMK